MSHYKILFAQWLKRDLSGRYRGAWLGASWPILQPIAQISVFTLVFFEFMRMRWPQLLPDQPISPSAWFYALNVLAGLCVFNFFAEVLGRAPTAILSQPNLITKVKFPLSVLPAVTTASATVHIFAGALALWVASAWTVGLSTAFWLVPIWVAVWMIPVVVYGLGFALVLSAFGVYVRDIQQVIPAIVSLLMFLTPIFYPSSAIPESLQSLFALNPIAWAAEGLRTITLGQGGLDMAVWLHHLLSAGVILILGWLFFQKLRHGFADVL